MWKSSSLLLALLLFSSCAAERTILKTEDKKESNMLTKFSDADITFEKGEDGMMIPRSDKRSDFEQKNFTGFAGKEVGKKSFGEKEASSLGNKSWEGRSQSYEPKVFSDGSKAASLKDKPYYVAQKSDMGAKKYQVLEENSFGSKSSSMAGTSWSQQHKDWGGTPDKPAMKTPEIEAPVMSMREYAKKTVEETNALLGRGKTDDRP